MATVGLSAMSQCICFKMTSTVDNFYEVERIVASREKVLLIHLKFVDTASYIYRVKFWSIWFYGLTIQKKKEQASWVRDHKICPPKVQLICIILICIYYSNVQVVRIPNPVHLCCAGQCYSIFIPMHVGNLSRRARYLI